MAKGLLKNEERLRMNKRGSGGMVIVLVKNGKRLRKNGGCGGMVKGMVKNRGDWVKMWGRGGIVKGLVKIRE